MNIGDNIDFLANYFSRNCFICNDENIKKHIPYFKIYKNQFNRLDIDILDKKQIKKELMLRMNDITMYLRKQLSSLQHNIQGYYNIELYDIYPKDTQLNYDNVLCFAKLKKDKHIPLIPDYYFIKNYNDRYINIDQIKNKDILWSQKKSNIIFVGSSTGDRNPMNNQRIQKCLWSLNHRDTCHFYITEFVNMNAKQVLRDIPELCQCYSTRYISLTQQHQYKYLLNIDGDTCRWFPDVYFMNTLNFQAHSNDMLWYYPLLKDKEHFVEVSFDELAPNYILKMYQYFENNPKEAQQIISNANIIAKQLFQPSICDRYIQQIFTNISENS